MKVRLCDICGEKVNECEPKIISIQQYIEDSEVPHNPSRDFDACDSCSDLFGYAFDNEENIKALFTSIRLRKSKLGVPKINKKEKEDGKK